MLNIASLLSGRIVTHSTNVILIHVCQIPQPYGLFSVDWEVPLGAVNTGALGPGRYVKGSFLLLSHLTWAHRAIGNGRSFGSQSALSLGEHRAKEMIHEDKHHTGCLVPLVTLMIGKLEGMPSPRAQV